MHPKRIYEILRETTEKCSEKQSSYLLSREKVPSENEHWGSCLGVLVVHSTDQRNCWCRKYVILTSEQFLFKTIYYMLFFFLVFCHVKKYTGQKFNSTNYPSLRSFMPEQYSRSFTRGSTLHYSKQECTSPVFAHPQWYKDSLPN